MKIVNRRYVSDEAAERIDKYIDGFVEGEMEEIGSQIPVLYDIVEPMIAVKAAVVCVKYLGEKYVGRINTCILVSETLAVFRDSKLCKDAVSVGEYILGFFDTPYKTNVDELIETVAKINSVKDLVQNRLENRSLFMPKVCIAVEYGTCLVNNYKSDGEVPFISWHGESVGNAMKLADKFMEEDGDIVITPIVRNNLKNDYQNYFRALKDNYVANIRNIAIRDWVNEHQ